MSPDNIEFAKLKARVALLERQIQFLLDHLELEYIDSQPLSIYSDVVELKRQGKLIEAIQLYRSKTEATLTEAKLFVDGLEI